MRHTRSYRGAARPIISALNINASQHFGSLFAQQQGQRQQQWRCVSSSRPEQQHPQRRQQHHHHQAQRQLQQQQNRGISTLSLLHIETTTGKKGMPARIPMPRIRCYSPSGDYCGGTPTWVGSGFGSASMTRVNSCGVSRGLHTPSSANSSFRPKIARAPVECGVVSPRRTVPAHIPKTPYYANGAVPPADNTIHLHTAESLVPMREACVLARDVLDLCCAMAQPGVTTDAIDAAVHKAIVEAGACPSPLNYHGFPKSVCSSVNEIACHAIPDDRPLHDGDLVSFDVSVFLKGFHGDNCATVGVGTIDAASQRLMDATQEATMEGVSVCRPGACLTEIGSAIHAVADRYGFDTVRKFCGHGVGSSFHMLPFVEHFRNKNRLELVPGMTFTIEPIFTEGSEATTTWSDGWTVQTRDGGRAAQFEHVVLITEEGHEVLTVPSRKT